MVYTMVLEAIAERIESSSLSLRTIYKGVVMNSEDVLNRAYGGIPKETTPNFNFDIVPAWRGFKYYWYKLIRKFTR